MACMELELGDLGHQVDCLGSGLTGDVPDLEVRVTRHAVRGLERMP